MRDRGTGAKSAPVAPGGRSGGARTEPARSGTRPSRATAEAEARTILATFDERLAAAERRIDTVLAKMGLE